jgi:hypothetical protein
MPSLPERLSRHSHAKPDSPAFSLISENQQLSPMNLFEISTELSRIKNRWVDRGLHVDPSLLFQFEALCQAAEFLELIESLRMNEGDSVQFVSDNADFNGQPNCLVVCCGQWTGWTDQRFAADTMLECLRAAKQAREQWKGAC